MHNESSKKNNFDINRAVSRVNYFRKMGGRTNRDIQKISKIMK